MKYVYHITKSDDWLNAKVLGIYENQSLKTQGFIHCAVKEQVVEIASQIFSTDDDLILLKINEERTKYAVVYENLDNGSDLYPHIYGPIEMDTVEAALKLKKNTNGAFYFPDEK
jgi:uncharacterized protein (DUF952 family)